MLWFEDQEAVLLLDDHQWVAVCLSLSLSAQLPRPPQWDMDAIFWHLPLHQQ